MSSSLKRLLRKRGPNAPMPAALSKGEETFNLHWKLLGGPEPRREHVFMRETSTEGPVRKWRFDFAWPEVRLAVEIEGGVNDGEDRGRHTRAAGFERDAVKYNEAALMGWSVIRLIPGMIQPTLLERLIAEIARRKNGSMISSAQPWA